MSKPVKVFFTFLLSIQGSLAAQSKGYALLVGASYANPLYDSKPVAQAAADADSMKSILSESGFETIVTLKGKDAKIKAILQHLEDLSKKVKKGDLFVFYFSGHGDTVPDNNKDEMPYTFDQQLVVADGWILDDTLFHFFKKFSDSVRLVFIADACFTGEMYKYFDMMLKEIAGPVRNITSKTAMMVADNKGSGCFVKSDPSSFDMIYVGAVDKDRISIPLSGGRGVLTHWIVSTWRYMKLMNYLDNYSMMEFFREACNSSTETMITRVRNKPNDIFGKKPAFKL